MKKFFITLNIFLLTLLGFSQVNTQDSLALIAFYRSTNGGSWTNTWDTTQAVSTWYSVKNNFENGRLTRLYLSNNNLTGTLPQEIGNLDSLIIIELRDNNLSGTLPPEIGNLSKIKSLSLENNFLSGELPAEIGNFADLYNLSINNNNFYGELPESIGNLTALFQLYLGNNLFSGPIPASIGNLTNIEFLDFSYNNFTSIPSSISQLSFHDIYLTNNPLLDSLPNNMFENYPTIGQGLILVDKCSFRNLPNPFPSNAIQLRIDSNKLTFGDIEPLLIIPHQYNLLYISPQDSICSAIDTTIHLGNTITLNAITNGQYNNYSWKKDGMVINSNNMPILTISGATLSDAGVYNCEVTNTVVTDLTINRRSIILRVDTSSIVPDIESDKITVFKNNAGIIFFNGNGGLDEINIYDTMGRLILNLDNIQLPYECFLQSGNSYIVNVTKKNKMVVYKLF